MKAWTSLKKPLFILAPMDDVTDTVFRRIVADCARPDVFFTEFVSVDGMRSPGREAVKQKLQFTEHEMPLVAQIWGLDPDNYRTVAAELAEQGYAGIDINMGCPAPVVIKNGACSALIKNRPLAADIIAATKEGAGGKMPVSVKTRIGFERIDTTWTDFLLEQGIDALTVHGRTTKEMSKVPNHWDVIEQVRKSRDAIAPDTLVIGNGDILTRMEGQQKIEDYGLDGVMVGRGIFQDPFFFAEDSPWQEYDREQKLALYRRHIELFLETWGGQKNPASLKKFAKVYVHAFDGASDLRARLMTANDAHDLLKILDKAYV